jgi:hypothetical protein
MECPCCGAELEYCDYYGKKKYAEHYWLYPRSWIEKTGDIYKCPNSDGFKCVDDVLEYVDGNEDDLEEYLSQHGIIGWDEVVCESCDFNGFFYTDKQGNLHEGYPC